MRPIKLNITIGPEKHLSIKLPDDIQEGPAELILLPSNKSYRSSETSFDKEYDDWLEELINLYPFEAQKKNLDKRIESERNSWN